MQGQGAMTNNAMRQIRGLNDLVYEAVDAGVAEVAKAYHAIARSPYHPPGWCLVSPNAPRPYSGERCSKRGRLLQPPPLDEALRLCVVGLRYNDRKGRHVVASHPDIS